MAMAIHCRHLPALGAALSTTSGLGAMLDFSVSPFSG
jgi:hypothetical protein